MAFTKRLRSYFFGTFPVNTRGRQTGFKNEHQPNQDRFEELTASAAFFTESDDRAAQDTGALDFENYVGLVAITSDAEATNLSRPTGLKADRTLVPHTGQLPTVAATETDTVADFSGVSLAVSVDGGVTTRNNFLVRLSTAFKVWLADIRTDLNTAQADITAVEGDIATINNTTIPALENTATSANDEVVRLRTLSGTVSPATNLGSFSGSIITTNTDIKDALQELETALESVQGDITTINNGGNLSVSDGTPITPVNTLTFNGTEFDVTGGGGIATVAHKITWNSVFTLGYTTLSGATTITFSPTVRKYYVLGKTLHLQWDFTATSATGVGFAQIEITPPSGTLADNSGRALTNVYSSGGSYLRTDVIKTSSATNRIYIEVPLSYVLSGITQRYVGQATFQLA